jgi:hypothetical protein
MLVSMLTLLARIYILFVFISSWRYQLKFGSSGLAFTRGFYCDDHTISYPYRDNTVSTLVLVLVSVGGTTLSV